jgi:hypothetical protein
MPEEESAFTGEGKESKLTLVLFMLSLLCSLANAYISASNANSLSSAKVEIMQTIRDHAASRPEFEQLIKRVERIEALMERREEWRTHADDRPRKY